MPFPFPARSDGETRADHTGCSPEPDEAVLLAAARADPGAFTALYQRYLGPVYRYCFVRLGDRLAAEDATSETFLKALAALPEHREGAFAAWLFRIAHNTTVDVHRRRRPTAPLETAAEPADPDPTPEDLAIADANAAILRAALLRLSDEQRAVIELQLAGWSPREIAATVGKTSAAIKMLRFRAISRLKTLLATIPESAPREAHDA